MGCCVCDDHDYCCRCVDSESERVHSIAEDILAGFYCGEVDLPAFPSMSMEDARLAANGIVAVLKHENVL